jgi:hypothetical protein
VRSPFSWFCSRRTWPGPPRRRESGQYPAALERRHPAPVASERRMRGLDGKIDVVGGTAGKLGKAPPVPD